MAITGGGGFFREDAFAADPTWEGEEREEFRECVGEVKDEVRERVPVVEGEVKEDVRGRVLMVGGKREVGEVGEVKEEDRGRVPMVPVGRREVGEEVNEN